MPSPDTSYAHWWCPDCGAFDGPITDGCCDACDPLDEHTSGVVRLVTTDALEAITRQPYTSIGARAMAQIASDALTGKQ